MSWSDLPAGLVAAIADELTDLADLARFRSVCPSWRSATEAHATRLQVPLLLLPTEGSRGHRRVWSVTDDSLREIPVPAALGYAFLFASYHGWMLAVDRDLRASLVYPFTGDSAGLPTLPFSSSSNDKVIRDLAWDWSPHGVVVSPGNDERAFFCRPGDESWRPVNSPPAGAITSVTYCQGFFYLFRSSTCTGTVVDAETLAVVAELKPPLLKEEMRRYWEFEANLLVSHDELLLLFRTQLLYSGYAGLPRKFRAFRADRGGGRNPSGWSEVAGGIGNRVVFVDRFRAFCVEANEGVNGLQRNCMYVARAHEEVNDDYGMDTNGRYTVEMLDLADLKTKSLWYGNLLKVRCSWFEQWPSWSLPKLH